MMWFTGLSVILVFYGIQEETWAMPDVNSREYHSVSSSHNSANREIPNIYEILSNMSNKLSTIDKEIKELQQHQHLELQSTKHSIDSHSSRISKLLSTVKINDDFCNAMTEELKKLKNATIHSLEKISEIGYFSREIIVGIIQCHHHFPSDALPGTALGTDAIAPFAPQSLSKL